MGSSPSGNTTTTTSNTPWSAEQPALESIYSQAQNLDTSAVPQYYSGDTYAPMTSQQTGAANNLINYGSGEGDTGLNAANSYESSALSPGYTAQASNAFTGANNVLNNEMSSSYLNPANSPTYNTAISNALAQAMPGAQASFTNGNRSDSGLASAASASAATNAAAGLAQQQYQANQGIQNSAAGQASNNLINQQGNQTRTALAAPMVDQAQSQDLSTALNTAGMAQTNQQNQLNANVAGYNYGQMLPWNQLGLEENAVVGTPQYSSSTTTQPYFSNTLSNVTSAATGLGSLGMLGYLALSDRRLKTDIHKVGESDSGFPLYTFRYKWDGPMTRHIGLMAQDIEKERPGAVIHTPVGMAVDYIKALTP